MCLCRRRPTSEVSEHLVGVTGTAELRIHSALFVFSELYWRFCKTLLCVSSLDRTWRGDERRAETPLTDMNSVSISHDSQRVSKLTMWNLSIHPLLCLFTKKLLCLCVDCQKSVSNYSKYYSMLFWVQSSCTFTSVRFILFKLSITSLSRLDQRWLISVTGQTSEN